MGTKKDKKFRVQKLHVDGGWSVGFGLTHDRYPGDPGDAEVYVFINFFRVCFYIGFMHDWGR